MLNNHLDINQNIKIFFSPQDSVRFAKKIIMEHGFEGIILKDGDVTIGYIPTSILLHTHPNRLLSDVPIKEIMDFPLLNSENMNHLMIENIPIVGIKTNSDSKHFLEIKSVYKHMTKQYIECVNFLEEYHPSLVDALMDEAQRLMGELEFMKESNLPEAGQKHHRAAFMAAVNVITSIIFILNMHKMNLTPKNMEEMNFKSIIREIPQRISSLHPGIIIEIDNNIPDSAPTILGDIFLQDMFLAIILIFTENGAFPGKIHISMSNITEEGVHEIKFDGPQLTTISATIEMNKSNETTSGNRQPDTPVSLFLRKVLERYHGSIRVIESENEHGSIILELPTNGIHALEDAEQTSNQELVEKADPKPFSIA